MRSRLENYIGTRARDVRISTFHSFAIGLVEKYYNLLDFSSSPKLLDDAEAIVLVDELTQGGTGNTCVRARIRQNISTTCVG